MAKQHSLLGPSEESSSVGQQLSSTVSDPCDLRASPSTRVRFVPLPYGQILPASSLLHHTLLFRMLGVTSVDNQLTFICQDPVFDGCTWLSCCKGYQVPLILTKLPEYVFYKILPARSRDPNSKSGVFLGLQSSFNVCTYHTECH